VGGGDEEFLGLLCLADCEGAIDENLLQAVVGQAAVALENARLFSRIAQSNRHWMEIFDAMEDLMLVHDESNHVLRVNRAMAESIGARPSELIGMSMRALVSFSIVRGSQGCPFCRRVSDGSDEYLHPVLGRTYLVSTSRIHGALEEGLQTIHVLKDITADHLIACIRDVLSGKTYLAPAAAARLAEGFARVQVTPRELSALQLMAEGKANKEIGTALGISERTVKTHLGHLFEKLGVTSRTEAVKVAVRRGLVRME